MVTEVVHRTSYRFREVISYLSGHSVQRDVYSRVRVWSLSFLRLLLHSRRWKTSASRFQSISLDIVRCLEHHLQWMAVMLYPMMVVEVSKATKSGKAQKKMVFYGVVGDPKLWRFVSVKWVMTRMLWTRAVLQWIGLWLDSKPRTVAPSNDSFEGIISNPKTERRIKWRYMK